jgi:uncharacterized protein (TIGR03085 family)
VRQFSAFGRQSLVAALRHAGPDSPTLCEGWTARDLAAHIVVRESRPDTGPGLALPQVPLLAGWTETVRKRYAKHDYDDLLAEIASGPPSLSPFSLPGVEGPANLAEFFIHTEDVRRAQPGWHPRDLDAGYERALWESLARSARLLFREHKRGVVLVVPDGPRRHVRTGSTTDVITGRPGELLMYASGRRDHALVEVS